MNENVQFLTDASGKRASVVLSLEDYERLLEDLAAVAERREEPTISHDEFLKDLREEGVLPA